MTSFIDNTDKKDKSELLKHKTDLLPLNKTILEILNHLYLNLLS